MYKNHKLSLPGSILLMAKILVVVTLVVTSCIACVQPTSAPQPSTEVVPVEASTLTACVDFEDQTLGTTYVVPNTFAASGVTIQVLPFQWGNMTWTSTGAGASVMDNMPNESDNAMFLNNVNLGLNLESNKCVTIQYCDKGGNENLLINGIDGNEADLQGFNGVNFNGVNVIVNVVDPQENCGEIRLEGEFTQYHFQNKWWITFAIGGQELYVDDICPCE